ncbi:MAG: hypothetical protein LBS59_00630 [Puniceicoccales bacterium]|jgi:hypothetical protein|nr:hypothetical protein [Puniceicoccales bacterium]
MKIKTFFLTFFLFLLLLVCRMSPVSHASEPSADTHIFASATEFAPFPFDVFSGARNDVTEIFKNKQSAFKKQNRTDKEKQYASGIDALREKRYKEASSALRGSVDTIGVDASILTALAWVAYSANEYVNASVFASRALESNGTIIFEKLNMAEGIYVLSQLKLESYRHCRILLDEWIDNHKMNGQYYLYRAMLWLLDNKQDNNLVNALDDVSIYLIHFPDDIKIQKFKNVLKKRILYNWENFDPEVLLSEKLLFPGFFCDMAMNAFRRETRSEYVLKFLKLSIEKEPKNKKAYSLLFFYYFDTLKDTDSAITCADSLIKMNPSGPYGYFLRGIALRKKHMRNAALQAFESAMERNLFDTDSLYNVVFIYAELSAPQLCIIPINLLREYEPFYPQHLMMKLQIELQMNELEKAKGTFQQLDELLKNNKTGETLRRRCKIYKDKIEDKERELRMKKQP